MSTIGRAKRTFYDEQKKKLPGVGSYNVLSQELNRTRGGSFNRAIRNITEYSLSSKSNQKIRSFSFKPGPGSYSLEFHKLYHPMSFTHSKRFRTDANLYPGPGTYKSQECSKQKIKAGIICRSARVTIQSKPKAPGPCDYVVPQVNAYKRKQPVALIGKAKRDLDTSDRLLLCRYTDSKQTERLQQKQYLSQKRQLSERKHVNADRAWHSRKISKQAKRMQNDQLEPLQ